MKRKGQKKKTCFTRNETPQSKPADDEIRETEQMCVASSSSSFIRDHHATISHIKTHILPAPARTVCVCVWGAKAARVPDRKRRLRDRPQREIVDIGRARTNRNGKTRRGQRQQNRNGEKKPTIVIEKKKKPRKIHRLYTVCVCMRRYARGFQVSVGPAYTGA